MSSKQIPKWDDLEKALALSLKDHRDFNPTVEVRDGKGSYYAFFIINLIENSCESMIGALGEKEILEIGRNHELALAVCDPFNCPKYPGLLSDAYYEHFITESRNTNAQMVPPVPIGIDPVLAVVVPTAAQRAVLKDRSLAIQQILSNHLQKIYERI
jgi:hypothetical protein